jgi:peptidoglycan-N-acetylglucosamine deacetylase
MSFLIRPPILLRKFYKNSVWRIGKMEPNIYLTFDDGPIPELTPWVLDVLNEFNVKATFFCVGDNIVKYPEIFERIKQEGHQIGNHTFNHMKGWKNTTENYLMNVEKCQQLTQTNLFRPPYGRIKKSQYNLLEKKYKVVFWDVLSYDYSDLVTPEQCLANSIKYTRKGSVIVFHDNIKAHDNLKFVLSRYISHFLELNFKFVSL